MARDRGRWTLQDLIDFEQVLSTAVPPDAAERAKLLAATEGLTARDEKRVGWRQWLEHRRETGGVRTGRKFLGALSGVSALLALLAALAGGSTVLGLWERPRGGINVSLFLALILGTQWLILIGALLAWIFRHRAGDAFSLVQGWVGALARKFAGEQDAAWWHNLMAEPAARQAMLWRLARAVQTVGVAFNLGALAALAGLILFRNVGFFWETTTEEAMRGGLEKVVKVLSYPWHAFDPASVPDSWVIEETRWMSGTTGMLPPGPREWWRFLLWSVVLWGMLPRQILRAVCRWQERRALAALDFQSRHHRAGWREWFAAGREEIHGGPADGALVIDVGGAGFSRDRLRPFLLQKLRVNPVAWETTGVLDVEQESSAREALGRAPAAIVLLAEGWALSPRQIESLLARVREVKENRRVILVVGNAAFDGVMQAVTPEERRTWERFQDGLAGTEIELVFHEGGRA